MKEIILTQNKIALVDDEDYDKINSFKWSAHRTYRKWNAVRGFKGKMLIMSRVIMHPLDGEVVDHINGNTLDNRKENLRNCSQRQNCQNKINCHANNSFGVKGITYNQKGEKFIARIRVNNKRIYLGSFNVLGDADSAYRIAEEKYFGEFARKY